MVFKLVVFFAILIAVAVLGTRGYRASVRRFDAAHEALPPGQA